MSNMKTKEEIEQLAFLEYPRLINDPYNPMEDDNTYERQIWIDAYTQCQEGMVELLDLLLKHQELTQWIEEEISDEINNVVEPSHDFINILFEKVYKLTH